MSHRRYLTPIVASALALVAALCLPAAAFAVEGGVRPLALVGSSSGEEGVLSWSLSGSFGLMGGSAAERVYAYPLGQKLKLSDLTWDLKDVEMAGVQGSLGIADRLRFDAGWWKALNKGSGRMVDRDWLYASAIQQGLITPADIGENDWTGQSIHRDTNLDDATLLNLDLTVRAFSIGPVSFSGILGYKTDRFAWTARGGDYIYSYKAFRDTVGSFVPGAVVIQYRQEYRVPYLGIGLDGVWRAFRVQGYLLFSDQVTASDRDFHLLRSTLFLGDFKHGTFFGAGVSGTYVFTPRWFVEVGVDYQRVAEMIGDASWSGSEGSGSAAGSGAVGFKATTAAASLGFRF